MPRVQKFGIKFPLESNDEETFIDLNKNYIEEKESELVHLILTRKGTKLRDPEFGTDLDSFLFEMSDYDTEQKIKDSLQKSVSKYIPDLKVSGIELLMEDDDPNRKVLSIDYTVDVGNITKAKNKKIRI